MLNRIKRYLFGDKRPIIRRIDHPSLGRLHYSADDEAWATRADHHQAGFRVLIDGDWQADAPKISPAPGLLAWAEEVLGDLQSFRAELEDFLASERSGGHKQHSSELQALEIDFFSIGPSKRPGEGTIYFKETSGGRCWWCDYSGRRPKLLGYDR